MGREEVWRYGIFLSFFFRFVVFLFSFFFFSLLFLFPVVPRLLGSSRPKKKRKSYVKPHE
ncbi:hypothetical protein DM02DRAFT_616737 [Periconia macrospinosa]|uniref:Transmembrane protein n=1 Tax=Periconia macrospinosa TaxID=97972 RepID=A0A2V1DGQ5_9PLEO|nr:hypothetical protein DM02DRAFT_616737 [Periconia macrospinosa]